MKIFFIFLTVSIGILTSVILDYVASKYNQFNIVVASAIAFVILINFLRFAIWGWLHKNFDISKTYPLTALFFPLIFMIAYLKGESQINWQKLLGLFLITLGIIVFEKTSFREE